MSEDKNGNPAIQPGKKKSRAIEITAAVFFIAGLIWIGSVLFDFTSGASTNNAQVDGDIASVTSRVSAYIKEVRFKEFDNVHAGDTLVILDNSEFLIKLNQAEADYEIAKANLAGVEQTVNTSKSNQASTEARLKGNAANLEKAEKNYKRFENMYRDSAVTTNQFDQVQAQLKSEQAYYEAMKRDVDKDKSLTHQNELNIVSAMATVKRKEADLASARLQLSYTVITAPVDGIAGERTIHPGESVNTNQVVVQIVASNRKWVMANFKETQLESIKTGQDADISIDALDGKVFKGKVSNFSPATGAKFSMVAPDNSTGNFVKITQRVPVRIEFADSPEKLTEIRPGMNVSVKLR